MNFVSSSPRIRRETCAVLSTPGTCRRRWPQPSAPEAPAEPEAEATTAEQPMSLVGPNAESLREAAEEAAKAAEKLSGDDDTSENEQA